MIGSDREAEKSLLNEICPRFIGEKNWKTLNMLSTLTLNLSSELSYFVLDENFFYSERIDKKLPIKNVLNFLRQKIPPGFDRFIILEIILENYFSVPIFSHFRTMTKISD